MTSFLVRENLGRQTASFGRKDSVGLIQKFVHHAQVETDFTNDDDVRVLLLVHDTRPPFLDGRVIFTKQAEPVLPLRDPTSDMAVIARSGSKLVREVRDKKEQGKSRQRFWEMAGSKMGKITGTPPLSTSRQQP